MSFKVTYPDLRIVSLDDLLPHEEHDDQRSTKLVPIIENARLFTNPPIVTAIDPQRFAILDGSNRYHVFRALGYPYLLVQVVSYHNGQVMLDIWKHIVTGWDVEELLQQMKSIQDLSFIDRVSTGHLMSVHTRSGIVHLASRYSDLASRNHLLNQLAALYQSRGQLFRTVSSHVDEIWDMYPTAVALIEFRPYTPDEIIRSTLENALLPPGVSRHIIQGRALALNYSMDALRRDTYPVTYQNRLLKRWFRAKLAQRQVRFYEESTFQFNE